MSDLDVPYTRLANDILEALAATHLSPNEWRFLMVVFRKTYGHQKKEDWIALKQITDLTGMHKSNVSRAKRSLIARNMVVATDNRIAFNKYHTQWRELSLLTTTQVVATDNQQVVGTDNARLSEPITKVVATDNSRLSLPTHTKEKATKEEILQKQPEKFERTNDELRMLLMATIEKFRLCDMEYAIKTWEQGSSLSADDRKRFFKKAVVVSSARSEGFARKVFHEMAGYVNDDGAMKHQLSSQEIREREAFADEMHDNPAVLEW